MIIDITKKYRTVNGDEVGLLKVLGTTATEINPEYQGKINGLTRIWKNDGTHKFSIPSLNLVEVEEKELNKFNKDLPFKTRKGKTISNFRIVDNDTYGGFVDGFRYEKAWDLNGVHILKNTDFDLVNDTIDDSIPDKDDYILVNMKVAKTPTIEINNIYYYVYTTKYGYISSEDIINIVKKPKIDPIEVGNSVKIGSGNTVYDVISISDNEVFLKNHSTKKHYVSEVSKLKKVN